MLRQSDYDGAGDRLKQSRDVTVCEYVTEYDTGISLLLWLSFTTTERVWSSDRDCDWFRLYICQVCRHFQKQKTKNKNGLYFHDLVKTVHHKLPQTWFKEGGDVLFETTNYREQSRCLCDNTLPSDHNTQSRVKMSQSQCRETEF